MPRHASFDDVTLDKAFSRLYFIKTDISLILSPSLYHYDNDRGLFDAHLINALLFNGQMMIETIIILPKSADIY